MSYQAPSDLIRYLPPYYEDNEEMIRLTDTENPETDSLWAAVKETTDNQFIRTSGDARLRQWEKLLRMHPDYALQSLDYRRDMIIMRLSTRVPLTYRWLENLLKGLAGEGRYNIKLSYNEYLLEIQITDRPEVGEDLWLHLRRVIPANLGLGFKHTLNNHVVVPYVTSFTEADTAKIFIPQPMLRDTHFTEELEYGTVLTDARRTVIPNARPGDIAGRSDIFAVRASMSEIHRAVIPHSVTRNVVSIAAIYCGTGSREYARVRIPTAENFEKGA